MLSTPVWPPPPKFTMAALLWLSATAVLAEPVQLTPQSVARPATIDEGKQLLSSRDAFVKSLSPFDRAARLKSAKPVTEKQLLDAIADQVRPFEDDEWKAIAKALAWNTEQLKRYNVPLPKEVLLIKVTGKVCADAAYTRGNAIILPQSRIATDETTLRKLVAHELYHVISRHAPELRNKLYAIVGFTPIEEPTLPKWLAARRITNPDAPTIDCYATLKVGEREVPIVTVLYSRDANYDTKRGGTFFRYMNFALMEIRQAGKQWEVVTNDEGLPKFYSPRDTPDYFKKIGRNTGYVIHPEEVLAENFMHLLDGRTELPDQRIVTEMADILRKDRSDEREKTPTATRD
jgi:hypothetical protein